MGRVLSWARCGAVVLLILAVPAGSRAQDEPAPAACLVHGVGQGNHADSQVFAIDLRRETVSSLGSIVSRADLEGLAVRAPGDHALYAVSGQQGRPRNELLRVDGRTGALEDVGPVGFEQVRALAVRTSDRTLWAWSSAGLLEIDAETGGGVLRFATDRAVEALAWSPDGRTLYAAHGHQLFTCEAGALTRLRPGLPDRAAAMVMRPDGKLLVAFVPGGGDLELGVVEPRTGRLVTTFGVPGAPADIRAITWPADCGNPSPGGRAPLIAEATLDRDVVCPNEPVRVDVATEHPEGAPNPVHVDVNGTAGSPVVLQFRGPPGLRHVQVTATTFEGHVDTITLTVEVVECEPGEAYPRVLARPSPFHELMVDFEIGNPEELGEGQSYDWDFGDGEIVTTDAPHAAHQYDARVLDRDAIFTPLEATVTVHAQGQPDRTVPKTVTLWNAYALTKRRGVVQPPVHGSEHMWQGATNWIGSFELANLEDEYVRFNSRRYERQFCDRDRAPEFEPARTVTIALRPQDVRHVVVARPLGDLGEDVCGLGVHYEGSTDSGTPARASWYFTLRDAQVVRETDPAVLEAANRAAELGLVADPDRITHEELYALALDGRIEYPVRSAEGGLGILQQIGEPCSPDDEPPEGWVCSATEEFDAVPPFIANARKGDLILSTACGTISQMLSHVSPPQAYEHEGIMTRNHDRISHSTVSTSRLKEHVVILPWPHISDDVMQFGWPGSLHQSVEAAFLGEERDAPGGEVRYTINSSTRTRPGAAATGPC